jgi:hypothetical protein
MDNLLFEHSPAKEEQLDAFVAIAALPSFRGDA